jgi:hypothetical protein
MKSTIIAVSLLFATGLTALSQRSQGQAQVKPKQPAAESELRPREPEAEAELSREREGGRDEGQEAAPPQALLDYVKKGVEAQCTTNKIKEPDQTACVDRIVNFEKTRRFQFLVGNRLPDAADYGWLIEFNIDNCEVSAACDVIFVVPMVKGTISGSPDPANYSPGDLSYLAASATLADARHLKNGWWSALDFKGNLQSVSVGSGNGTSLSPDYHAMVLSLNGHTWQYFAEKGFYYDEDQYREKVAKAEKKQEQEEQAQFQRNSAWLRKTTLALPLHWGQSQSEVKEILWRSGYRELGFGGTPWVCQSSGWQINQSDFLAAQGVVAELQSTCMTGYQAGNNVARLALVFEIGLRKRDPDRGTVYDARSDRLVMLISQYENKGEEGGASAQDFKRMSAHDCKIMNEDAKKYDNGELCIPF